MNLENFVAVCVYRMNIQLLKSRMKDNSLLNWKIYTILLLIKVINCTINVMKKMLLLIIWIHKLDY